MYSNGLIAQQSPSSIRLQEFRSSFRVSYHIERTTEILHFLPPTLPSRVILRGVVG